MSAQVYLVFTFTLDGRWWWKLMGGVSIQQH